MYPHERAQLAMLVRALVVRFLQDHFGTDGDADTDDENNALKMACLLENGCGTPTLVALVLESYIPDHRHSYLLSHHTSNQYPLLTQYPKC